jgi:hypothetical protein
MEGRGSNERVVRVHNLEDYFRTSIESVIDRHGVRVDPHAAHYVVNLLTLFSRSEEFYEDDGEHYGLRPFALLLADAADASSPEQRTHSLQRIGDVALFVAGFFAESLDNKPVDIDYYIYMGGNAYGSLSDEVRGTFRGNAFADIYRELAVKFQVLVDVLNEVRDEARQDSVVDLMRTYRIWRKTGSRRALRILRQHGIVPIGSAGTPGRPAGRH